MMNSKMGHQMETWVVLAYPNVVSSIPYEVTNASLFWQVIHVCMYTFGMEDERDGGRRQPNALEQ